MDKTIIMIQQPVRLLFVAQNAEELELKREFYTGENQIMVNQQGVQVYEPSDYDFPIRMCVTIKL